MVIFGFLYAGEAILPVVLLLVAIGTYGGGGESDAMGIVD